MEFSELNEEYKISIHENISEIADLWASLTPIDILLSPEFLSSIEKNPPSGIIPYYVIVYNDSEAIGVVYYQYKYIRLKESLKDGLQTNSSIFSKLKSALKRLMVQYINMPTLVCGNMMLTGTYGFYFKVGLGNQKQMDLLANIANRMQQYLSVKGKGSGLTLIKDFYTAKDLKSIDVKRFTRFEVQPDMNLFLKPNWKSFDDYLQDMKSKYRIRVRRAQNKCGPIERKELDADAIRFYENQIHALYQNVSNEAGFNLFTLHRHYFATLKENLGSGFSLIGYFSEGKMIGFFTAIKNFGILDAHFLGYDPEINALRQIYLNMLYDLIKMGINERMSQVAMSRTALEIKSSVGAEPQNMYLYLRHSNPIINRLVPPILKMLTPAVTWKSRSPFRD